MTDPRDTTSQSDLRIPEYAREGLVLRVVASPDARALTQVLRLNASERPGKGTEKDIGRDEHCDLTLHEGRVSRRHALVQIAGPGGLARLTDAGSKNGLRVNGNPTQAYVLRSGDVVRIGDSILVVDVADGDDVLSGEQATQPDFVAVGTLSRAAVRETLRAAPTDLSVLFQGPSGTGKEVYSAALHHHSGRRGPFHAVNCGAIPRELVEASLFGHRKGAFTGAVAAHDGHVRSAQGGTLFLDEVAELSLAAQVALLRVIEAREVTPVGSTRSEPVDVRIVAATHQDLRAAVAAGSFRDDLYARLAEWTIAIPALEARRADIPPLVSTFVGPDVTLHPDALEALLIAPWPHNVRGLRAAVRQADVRARSTPASASTEIRLAHLPPAIADLIGKSLRTAPGAAPGPFARPSPEELKATLSHYGGRIHLVAQHFGKDRRQIYRWLEYAGLSPKGDDGPP
ncbi:MAG: sigma 54-interacting transcriptional regulator [Myxococcales bacterium]|nr:sigma 54-interacting transcriptional regulator [Myxococcales bacterium]